MSNVRYDDSDVETAMRYCRLLGVRVHVRGTDDHPIVELKDRRSNLVVGGRELKRRIEIARKVGVLK